MEGLQLDLSLYLGGYLILLCPNLDGLPFLFLDLDAEVIDDHSVYSFLLFDSEMLEPFRCF